MSWQPFPMVRIATFFAGGVLLGIYLPDFIPYNLVLVILAIISSCYLAIEFFSKEHKHGFYSGLLGLTAIFVLGYCRLFTGTISKNENHISRIKESIEAYEAIVRSVPQEKAKSWKIELEIVKVKTSHWQSVAGNLQLYLSRESIKQCNWHYGDHILVKGAPQELRGPANPGEFDFKRFLSFKNISHQHFVLAENVRLIRETTSKGFIYYSHQARAWCMNKLNQFVKGEDERTIAIALVLGVTDGIDNDLQNAYAASGAMHVLAVSGMHVGIIYAIILFLFRPFEQFKNSKWIVAVVSLICLWSFSFVTGNSPSVLRAVTMFSFIAIARPFAKRTNIYNTLAASVFVLLIYNPYLIMSVGFQLSYLAVLGIVYLQRPIYRLMEIENYVGDWVWKITCVSMAAQVSTFALGLLYFHQFPTYFLVSNLFVIPLSTFVLLGGIFLLAISFISPLASFVGLILEWLIKALNWIVFKTEALPFSLINNIHLTVLQCWLLMGILLCLILLMEIKSIRWLYAGAALTLLFSATQWIHFSDKIDQEQLIVYSINKHQAIEYIDRGQSHFAFDSLLTSDRERIRFHIQPNQLAHGVSFSNSMEAMVEMRGVKYFLNHDELIAWMDDPSDQLSINTPIDYLIVSGNALQRNQVSKLKIKQIIFDGTNSKRFVDTISKLASENRIDTYSVLEKGAFIIN